MKQTNTVLSYLILSIIASALILLLPILEVSNIHTININDKLFIGGAFITSCLLGISLTMYPGWYKRITKQRNHSIDIHHSQKKARKRQGHHPDCNQFQNHTIKIKNKTLCAGCFGLSIGSLVSIVLMTVYISLAQNMPITLFYILLALAFIIIGLVYVEIIFPKRHSTVHIVSNISLVVSFFLITISIFEATGSIIYGITSVILSFLWLDTRIQLSNWRHTVICKNCSKICKMY